MEHHSLYDSKTSQHKNYTEGEVRRARTKLYGAIAAREHFKQPATPKGTSRKIPHLYIVFEIGHCAWSVGGQMQPDGKMKKMMQISFWATFTTDGDEPVLILEAYPEGTEPILSATMHRIQPRRLNRIMISRLRAAYPRHRWWAGEDTVHPERPIRENLQDAKNRFPIHPVWN